MDLAPLEAAVVTAAALIVSASAPIAVAYLRAHVKNAAAEAALERAVTLGAVVAHDALSAAVAGGATVDWTAAENSALAEGLAAAQQLAAAATPEAVKAALVGLLAAKPVAPAPVAPAVPAPAPAPAAAQ